MDLDTPEARRAALALVQLPTRSGIHLAMASILVAAFDLHAAMPVNRFSRSAWERSHACAAAFFAGGPGSLFHAFCLALADHFEQRNLPALAALFVRPELVRAMCAEHGRELAALRPPTKAPPPEFDAAGQTRL